MKANFWTMKKMVKDFIEQAKEYNLKEYLKKGSPMINRVKLLTTMETFI